MLLESETDQFSEYLRSIVSLLVLNLVLGSSKLILGYVGQSSAMRSDGWNNSADFLYSVLLTAGLWLSTRPADQSHPEGHERFESLLGILISAVIILTGAYVLWDSVVTFFNPRAVQIGAIGAGVLILSMGLKGGIAWFLVNEENRLSSPALGAIGRDQAGDVLADLSVLAAMLSSYFSHQWIDPAVAGMIGLLILKLGWDPMVENIQHLTGRAPSDDIVQSIKQRVADESQLHDPTHVRAHYVGPSLHVSLTVKASGNSQLDEVHREEERLRDSIMALGDVGRVFIHVEPFEADSPN